MSTALIYLQTMGAILHSVSYELAKKAESLSEHTAGILVCESLSAELEGALAQTELDTVYIYTASEAKVFMQELHLEAIKDAVDFVSPEILLFGATLEGRTMAPMVAACLKTGVTADCTALALDDSGNLIQTRPAFGGRIMASIVTKDTRPQIATVRPGVFEARTLASNKRPKFIQRSIPAEIRQRVRILSCGQPTVSDQKQKDIVVAIGGGLKAKEDVVAFEVFAKKLGASLMCSRALVERGWLAQSAQIGLSGSAVAPKLLITFGVSGSEQFMAGIQNAKKRCAVNIDREAEILKVADIPICGDMYDILEKFS